jgi:hypothetical protein
LVLRKQRWRIWPVQHRLLLLNSQLICTSWETSLNFRSCYISGGKLAWISVAMVQFAALWIVVIQNLRTVRFHFPRKKFSFGVLLVGPEFWCG